MSRIGNRELTVPSGVTVTNENGCITVKGPKGELSLTLNPNIDVKVEDNKVTVTRNSEIKTTKQMHGTTNALIKNMIIGVSEGYEKGLEIIGVGYRFNLKGNVLVINAGYSHPVELEVPEGLSLEAKGNNQVTVSGISKEKVGEFAAIIRKVREPEPYKGKGIRYVGEYVRRKEGKKAK